MNFPIFATAAALAEFAPIIAKWIGGEKSEKVAAQVVDTAKRITGEKEEPSIIRSLSSHPDVLLKFQKEMLQLYKSLEHTEYEDRHSARSRDLAFFQAGRRNLRADIMVICAAGGLGLCLVSLAFFKGSLPGEAVGIISTVAGIFGSCLKDAYAFEFGSSRGSKEKDDRVTAVMMGQLK
jgi:hypothetical protein